MRKRLVAGVLACAFISLFAALSAPGPRKTAVVVERPAPPAPPAEAPREPKAAPEEAAAKEALSRRRDALEKKAIATLRNIVAAQAQFQAAAWADEDKDGTGEYGSLAELAAAAGARDGEVIVAPLLAPAFRTVGKGRVERDGYRFRIYLPGANGRPVPERDGGGIGAGQADPDLAEACWCAYAWPAEGEGRTFFTNQVGDVLSTTGYAGDLEPEPCAAFLDDSGLAAATAVEDGRHVGADRREWKPTG